MPELETPINYYNYKVNPTHTRIVNGMNASALIMDLHSE